MTHIRCFRFSVRFSRLSCCLLSFQRLWFNKRSEPCHACNLILIGHWRHRCIINVWAVGTVAHCVTQHTHSPNVYVYSILTESNVLRLCFSNAFRLPSLSFSFSLAFASNKINAQYPLVICFKRIKRWQMEEVLPHRLSIYLLSVMHTHRRTAV